MRAWLCLAALVAAPAAYAQSNQPIQLTPPPVWSPSSPDTDPNDIAMWQAAGVPAAEIPSWKEIGATAEDARGWVASGIGPDQLKAYLSAGLALSDRQTILRAIELRRAGFSMSKAVSYAQQGLTPMAARQLEQQKAQEAAAEQAQAEAAQAARQERAQQVAAVCPNGVRDASTLDGASPFNLTGICFQAGPFEVNDWLDAKSALANGNTYMIDADTNLPGTTLPSGIYIGEDAYQYETVSGGSRTVMHLKMALPDGQ